MKSFKKLALLAGVASSVLLYSGTATAQETTSSLRGKVVSTSGAPMSGVTVVITHIPTGTTSTITTNSSGVYSARGLKVGGPYRVRLSDGSEYTAQTVEDLFLTLGTSSTVNLTAQAAGSIEEIVVTASQISSMIKTGASSLYGSDDLASMPSIGRDIKSTIRQDPAIWVDPTNSNALGIAGTNNRTNSFTVDGIRQNDDFGLNGNGYPTQRSPVSIDAIAQVAVQTAPFDVTYGRFQGGNINVVTKSGTNEFHGSAFYEYSDAGLVGSKSGTDEINVGEFKEKTYGFTFGGPIVQDKLFFFASYEKFDSTRPFEFGPEGSGASNEITGVTQADIDRVIEISNSVYGFDPLSFGGVDLDESDEKILVKMDWNITDNHRMTATYQRTDGNIINPQNTFDSFFGGGAGLLSTWYDKNDKLTTYSGQLFSDWSDNFSTEVKIGWKEVVTGQNPLGGTEFGLFDIDTPGGGSIFIGPDFFRHGNALSNDAFSLKIKADYVVGDHLITFGYERDTLDVFNLFVPGSRGDYTFDSIDDFEAQTPSSVYYSNAVTNNVNDGAARFKTTDNVVYIQDRFTPTDNLTVFAGVRLEWFQNDSSPLANANFLARNGFSNTGNLDGKSLILPRFGFNYVFDDRTVVRGGFGLFGGGSPNVWVSNSYSNNGVNIDSVFLPDPGIVDGFNVPQAAQDALTEGDGNVNAISPDANLPSIWKANIAVDYEFDLGSLGDGWDVTAEAIFARTKDQFIWTEARRSVVGTAPDGRPIYDVPGGYDLILDSTDLGKSDTYTINVSKQWVTDVGIFNARVGWAHIDAEDVNPGQSSTATSNFGKVSVTDRNNPTLAISDHEISNRYTATVGWRHNIWGDNETALNLFYSRRSGRHFSFTFDDPGNRSGSLDTLDEVLASGDTVFGGDRDFWRRDTQLLYLPSGASDPLVDWDASTVTAAEFDAFASKHGLEEYKGMIVPRNVGTSPSVARLDMKFSQEVIMPWSDGGHKIKLYLDMENLSNMLNNDWGRVEQVPFHYAANVADVEIVEQDDGSLKYVFTGLGDPRLRRFDIPSLWKVKIGISYNF